jgi:hypothetical protein
LDRIARRSCSIRSSSSACVDTFAAKALARKTIEFVDAPETLKAALTDLLNNGIAYYRKDDDPYEEALNRGFSLPEEPQKLSLFDCQQEIFDASKKFALRVIEEIQGYAGDHKA